MILALVCGCLLPAAPSQDSRQALRADLARLWTEQRYEDLLRKVEPLLSATRDSADLWFMAAEAALKLEDHARAIAGFERGLGLDPSLAAARINLGFAYLKVDRAGEARAVFESFLRDQDPKRAAKAHYGLGLVHLAEGRTEDALAAFRSAATLDPADARPHYRLGQLALQAGDHAGAVASFKAALRHDELHAGAAFGLARVYARLGDEAAHATWTRRHRKILEVGDAVAALIRRLGDGGDAAAARVAIGLKLQEAEAHEKAAAWFRLALKLDPANEPARRHLASARQRAESRP
jgi:tetratricopeptide (TPR) repeat protein